MAAPFELHHLVRRGDLARVQQFLRADPSAINAYDHRGYSPLMHALESPRASADLVRLLLHHGADLHQESSRPGSLNTIMALCLAGGDPQKLAVLLENGAHLDYQGNGGPLIHATQGRDLVRDPHLLDLLNILIARGVELNAVTSYQESALRRLSNNGRFDAVELLLNAGADEQQLAWTTLIRAVALGSLSEVREALEARPDLEATDWWSRTAFLVAIQTGDIAKANLLLDHGAHKTALGRCQKPPLFYAIENHHAGMLEWLLEFGASVEQTDEFGMTPLMTAVESSNIEAVNLLLEGGAAIDRDYNGQPAVKFARTREIVLRLLEAGADPAEISFEGRRSLVGLYSQPDESLLELSAEDLRQAPSRRFGKHNPELMAEPFWEAMIRAGITASEVSPLLDDDEGGGPIWCAQRFGQSITLLHDGRIVQIGGEHEDFYDSDFCIYNDVFVHSPDGSFQIFGYPKAVFPPTDFHTATLLGDQIYIIGCLGYQGTRLYGETPVYRLDTHTFRIERLIASGTPPGWISRHRAVAVSAHEIRVFGGKIDESAGNEHTYTDNASTFVLDTNRLLWRTP